MCTLQLTVFRLPQTEDVLRIRLIPLQTQQDTASGATLLSFPTILTMQPLECQPQQAASTATKSHVTLDNQALTNAFLSPTQPTSANVPSPAAPSHLVKTSSASRRDKAILGPTRTSNLHVQSLTLQIAQHQTCATLDSAIPVGCVETTLMTLRDVFSPATQATAMTTTSAL